VCACVRACVRACGDSDAQKFDNRKKWIFLI